MTIATLDITQLTKAVRRHDALLRYARYMLVFNLVIFIWFAAQQFAGLTSLTGLVELVTGPSWQWAAFVIGSVAATYIILAHRLWWAYAAIFLAQVAHFFLPSPDKAIFKASLVIPYDVLTEPAMRPLAPLALELAIMTLGFCYIMIVYGVYSAAWTFQARAVPIESYGQRPTPLGPLHPSQLLETGLPGHKSQSVSRLEAAHFATASLFFVAASMAFFFGIRRIQDGFAAATAEIQDTCLSQAASLTPQAQIACMAQHYPWTRAAFDLGVPIAVAIACLILANTLRHAGRHRFLQRLARRPIAPAGSTLFLRAFRDDQVRIRRASRNLFSFVFDLGRTPGTLDELMLERLDGRGDLIAIGNPRDNGPQRPKPVQPEARIAPWGAHRLYVGDADWQQTVTRLASDADRIVLCVDASDGVRWEIAHVLQNHHAAKTLFFLNPALDAATRHRLLTNDFAISKADLAPLNLNRILALRRLTNGTWQLILCATPEREAHLVAARLAFANDMQPLSSTEPPPAKVILFPPLAA